MSPIDSERKLVSTNSATARNRSFHRNDDHHCGTCHGVRWQSLQCTRIKNNIAIIAQLGIIATGAALLMIAGEFDLSIGPMIAFAGMSIAVMLKWGFLGLGEATPILAF